MERLFLPQMKDPRYVKEKIKFRWILDKVRGIWIKNGKTLRLSKRDGSVIQSVSIWSQDEKENDNENYWDRILYRGIPRNPI